MPNNYLPLSNVDNKAMERTKLENARVRCTKIAKDIEERLVGLNSLPPKAIDPFLLHVVHPLFCWYAKRAYRNFAVEEGCTGCGLCAKVCPQKNIRLEGGRPVWGKTCASCMACIHWCPVQAIQYGKKTKSFGRYHNPNINVSALCGGEGGGQADEGKGDFPAWSPPLKAIQMDPGSRGRIACDRDHYRRDPVGNARRCDGGSPRGYRNFRRAGAYRIHCRKHFRAGQESSGK